MSQARGTSLAAAPGSDDGAGVVDGVGVVAGGGAVGDPAACLAGTLTMGGSDAAGAGDVADAADDSGVSERCPPTPESLHAASTTMATAPTVDAALRMRSMVPTRLPDRSPGRSAT